MILLIWEANRVAVRRLKPVEGNTNNFYISRLKSISFSSLSRLCPPEYLILLLLAQSQLPQQHTQKMFGLL